MRLVARRHFPVGKALVIASAMLIGSVAMASASGAHRDPPSCGAQAGAPRVVVSRGGQHSWVAYAHGRCLAVAKIRMRVCLQRKLATKWTYAACTTMEHRAGYWHGQLAGEPCWVGASGLFRTKLLVQGLSRHNGIRAQARDYGPSKRGLQLTC